MEFSMVLFTALAVLGVLQLRITPVLSAKGSERAVRVMVDVKQLLTQLQADNENHRIELSNLFVEKTEDLRELIMQQVSHLNLMPSEIASRLKEEIAAEETRESEDDGDCPLHQVMLDMLQENTSNFTDELTARLNNEMGCSAETAVPSDEDHDGENCLPVPVHPDDSVKLFKLKARGVGVCSNPDPVMGLNKCQGGCSSDTKPVVRGGRVRFVNTCSCCQPARFEKISVNLICQNGYSFNRAYDNIVECQCLRCDASPDGEEESD